MTKRLQISAILLSTLLQGVTYLLWGKPGGLVLAILVGAIWLLTALRDRLTAGTVCFIASSLLTMLAALGSAPGAVVLLAWVSALAAWDLSRFQLRLALIEPVEYAKRLERLHLLRLGYTLGAGLLVSLIAVYARYQLTFRAALVIGLAAFITLSLAIRRMMTGGDHTFEK